MSLLNTLDIGQSALSSAGTGIATTAHNVANASTEGYSRRTVGTSAADPVNQGGLLLGAGVRVDSIARSTDALLGVRLVDHTGGESESRAKLDALYGIESYFNESNSAGISQTLEEMFDSFVGLTADPSDPSLRSSALESARRFASTLSSTYTGVEEMADGFVQDATSSLDEVNAQLQELADLNAAVVAAGGGLEAGDLAEILLERLRPRATTLLTLLFHPFPANGRREYSTRQSCQTGSGNQEIGTLIASGSPPSRRPRRTVRTPLR